MSFQKRVRRKIPDPVAEALDYEELVETAGITFDGGQSIELAKDGTGSLGFLDSKSNNFHQRIKVADEIYVPPMVAPSLIDALTLPSKRGDCGSTVELFALIRSFFLDHGIAKDAAEVASYFVFTSWFPELIEVAPCLIITGAETQARVLLQLLCCLVRHAVPLAEINVALFNILPMHLEPSLLIDYVPPSLWRLFSASNYSHTNLPSKIGLTNLFCTKATYAGPTLGGFSGEAVLNINCASYGGNLSGINRVAQEQFAAEFQPKLLDFRFKYIRQVQNADFDAPTLTSPLRMVARSLGRCVIDAAELQAGIIPLLESQEAVRPNRLLDPIYIAIEAMFAHCHRENGPIRVRVSELAVTAGQILADRGESTLVESKRMGTLLRRLGFRPIRQNTGFVIELTVAVRHLIHRLARDYQIGDAEQPVPGCRDCVEAMSSEMDSGQSV